MPVIEIAPLAEVMTDGKVALFDWMTTPKLSPPLLTPPMPVKVMLPLVLSILAATPPLLINSMPLAPAKPARPVPRSETAPAPEDSCAPFSAMPYELADEPIAARSPGVAPPPRVMKPPLLSITVPLAREMAPPVDVA